MISDTEHDKMRKWPAIRGFRMVPQWLDADESFVQEYSAT